MDELSGFFAKAEISDDGHSVDYFVPPFKQATPYSALSDQEKKDADGQIEDHVSKLMSLLSRLDANGQTNERNMVAALEGIFYLPNKDSIYMVDGKVVLVAWGYGEENSFVDIRTFRKSAPDDEKIGVVVPWWRRKLWWLLLLLLLLLLLGWLALRFIWPCLLWFQVCTGPVAEPDRARLEYGNSSISIPITKNDTHPEGLEISVLRCDKPGVVVDEKNIRYDREGGVTSGDVTFICEVKDPRGLTDRALVTVTIDEAPRVPPTANSDDGRLKLGEAFAEVDVVKNDKSSKGGSVTLESCEPPGAVRDGKALYLRDPSVAEGSVTFNCTVRDEDGETSVAPVVIDVEPANRAPTANELVVNMPLSVAEIEIPVLGAISDPDPSDTHRILECSPFGRVDGTSVRFARPKDPAIEQRKFRCKVEDSAGNSVDVPVTVKIQKELRNCDPIETAAKVHFHIGVDRSGSMSGPRERAARTAVNNILDTAGPNVSISLALISSTPMLFEGSRSSIKRRLTATKFTGGENFGAFSKGMLSVYEKTKRSVDRFVVVTLTDAPSGNVASANADFRKLQGQKDIGIETSFIYVGPKQAISSTKAKYGGFVSRGGVFEDINSNPAGIDGLIKSLSAATRLSPRPGCE
jgi:hypothetical protein